MNFQEFKNIMNELKDLGYIKVKEYDDHIFVHVKEQENKEVRDLIVKKIKDIYAKSERSIGFNYNKERYEIIFIETKNLIKCFYEENYEKIAEKIKDEDLSYIEGYVHGKGVSKYIQLWGKNYYGNNTSGYSHPSSYEHKIINAILKCLPDDIEKTIDIDGQRLFTKKATEWEEKRKNCAEIKISEDFDKILSKY